MAQFIDEGLDKTVEGQVQDTQFDLKSHLSKYSVPNTVYRFLCDESITVDELVTFTVEEVREWCNEHSLKLIEKKRFLNAVKSLPNSQANKPDESKIVTVFLGNEEKEQLSQLDDMKNNVENIIDHINEIENKSKVDEIIKEINNVCDEIQSYVERLRQTTVSQVQAMQMNRSQSLLASVKAFEKLLKLIQNTNENYTKYLANINKQHVQATSTKAEMAQKISKCKQEYDETVLNNGKTVSQNNSIIALNYSMEDIKEIVENQLVQIETTQLKRNDEFIQLQKFANIKFSNSNYKPDSTSYSICQFDLKYTKLTKRSTIDFDDKHIKIGPLSDYCYGMILPNAEHVQGYKSGQHCFRMYYKHPKGPNAWMFFGIYKYGIVPQDKYSAWSETSWGFADGGAGQIHCNGKIEQHRSSTSFLYSLNENQIDMFVDFDKGILSYSIVDDKKKGRKYTFKNKFNTNIAYTVHLNLRDCGVEAQIAKINVNMFGKDKNLVQWPIKTY